MSLTVDSGNGWFVVLPDREPAGVVAARLQDSAGRPFRYESGRPWIVGNWTGVRVDHCRGERLAAVLIGIYDSADMALRSRLATARRLEDLDGWSTTVAGSFHLIATDGETVRIQGPVFNTRRVFHTMVGDIPIGTDRAQVAAWLSSAPLDPDALALQLGAAIPAALAGTTPWRDVHAVPGGSALCLTAKGDVTVRRWWRSPATELTLAEGAPRVREALQAAVQARVAEAVRSAQPVAADLSGGIDSTSVCFLARRSGAELVTATLRWQAAGNEDAAWAGRAAGSLSPVRQFVYDNGDLPAFFAGLDTRRPPTDEPGGTVRMHSQVEVMSAQLAATGAALRLTGHGGDHLTHPALAFLPELVRSHPLLGARQLAAYRARARWSGSSVRQWLVSREDYSAWLRSSVGREPSQDVRPPSWEPEPSLPPWASQLAHDRVRAAWKTAAADAEPLAPSRGQHARIHDIMRAGALTATLTQSSSRAGLPLHAPFCDDAVVEASLAIPAHEIRTPSKYKPLLVEAMRDIVPAELLSRTTKDQASVEWYSGLRRHAAELAALAVDSELVALGLVDEARFRAALANPELVRRAAHALELTISLETWLRDVARYPNPVSTKGSLR